MAREQCRASLFAGAARIKIREPAAISLVWATLPILWPDPWLVDQSGTLFSAAGSVPAAAAVVRLRFVAARFFPLFGVPGYTAIQTERAPADSNGGPSREPPRRSRA